MAKDTYKNIFKHINKFFKINTSSENFHKEVFETLRKIVDYNSCYIFFITPEKITLEYSHNPQITGKSFKITENNSKKLFKGTFDKKTANLTGINCEFLAQPLKIKEQIFGYIIITLDKTTAETAEIFDTCGVIISNLIKENELAKIHSMQIQSLQSSIKDINYENQKIVRADKIKNYYLANISHELRTPLNSIIGFSELLDGEFNGKLNNTQKEYVRDIHISSLHLLSMINEILDISKIESGTEKLNKTQFSSQTVTEEVCNIIAPLVQKKKIKLTKNVDNFVITADYRKIQQILFNLLSNAIKFTAPNGKIDIIVLKKNTDLVIKIKDNGIGIDKKYHDKIFEKFIQIENPQIANESSTGLGLTITKKLVELHNGTINLKSTPGKGSEFSIIVPIF